ncbi:hypothetical protein RYX36_003817 [Vicia faba]
MAGIFSLGGTSGVRCEEDDNPDNINNPININPPPPEFWYNTNTGNKPDDPVGGYRSFEIWNQQQQQHQFLPMQQDLYTGVALGVGPSRVLSSDDNRSAFVVASGSVGGISCQDCGNQAKKDCPHARCRTCCKSRGFDCQTHVKSTWVPAARRRERQQQQQQLAAPKPQYRDIVTENRQRDLHNNQIPNNSALACARLPSNPLPTAGLVEEVNFPAVVNSSAEFRCVRVTSVDDSEEEIAYSTAVNISGHVFRGILYNYGADMNNNYISAGNTPPSGGEAAALPLNLVSSVPGELVDPASMYPAPLSTFMPPSGTQFFPNPRS